MSLKIGIVCPYDYFRFGGVQEHVRAVAAELRARGHDVKVIAPTPSGGRKDDDSDVIVIGASTKMHTPLATSLEVAVSASPRDIDDMYDREQFDIMHFHEPWVPLLSGQLLSRSPAKNLATFHAHLPDDLINKSLELIWFPYGKNRAKYIHYITAVSDAAAEYVRTVTEQEVHIIPNGIELKKYNPAKIGKMHEFADKKKTILYIGRLEKRKGVEHLLKAYRELRKEYSNVRLVIAGDGPKRRNLDSYVEKYDLPDVTFLGFVSEADKLSLLKTCDVFCSPALFGESFGIVLLEAMAMGVPVVAGNNPGYRSVMRETGRLSLVDARSTIDLAHKLELMLYDDAVRRVFTEWAGEYVKQFDYKLITDKYEAAYKEIL